MRVHWGWAYDGVNGSIPRNTGAECANYLTTTRHIVESLIIVPLAIIIHKYGMSKLPKVNINYAASDRIVFGKQLLLITMTFLLGLEMGFKLCTRSAIFILNPCHVTSMLQVYLLAAKPSKWTTTLFRIHINFLNGPLLAFLFPEHESRRITFELPTYYIQHGLMFVIPAYLLRHGGMKLKASLHLNVLLLFINPSKNRQSMWKTITWLCIVRGFFVTFFLNLSWLVNFILFITSSSLKYRVLEILQDLMWQKSSQISATTLLLMGSSCFITMDFWKFLPW